MTKKPAWAATARTGPVRRFQNLAIFACEGMVCIIDEREADEGDFIVVAPAVMVERIRTLNADYRRKRSPSEMNPGERQEYYQQIQGSQNCMECVKEARHMGDPTDPAVQAWWTRQRRNVSVTAADFAPAICWSFVWPIIRHECDH